MENSKMGNLKTENWEMGNTEIEEKHTQLKFMPRPKVFFNSKFLKLFHLLWPHVPTMEIKST